MNITPAQLTSHLQQGLRPLYTLHGDEPLLVQEAGDAIRAAARAQGHTERSAFSVSGAHFDWSAVLAAGSARSLFAERQLIELRLPSGKPGKDGSLALQRIAEAAAEDPGTLWLVQLPRPDKSTRASAWFGALERHGVVLAVEPVDRAALPAWLAKRLAAQDQRVEPGEAGQRALAVFADRVEGNLLAAQQEIAKLGLLHPPGELTQAQIEAAVLNVARYDVFKLSEAVLAGRYARVQRMLDGLRAEGTAEVLVHYALAEDIRALKRGRDALDAGQPLPMAMRALRVWGPRERLIERVLPRIGSARLAHLLRAAHLTDGIVKGLPQPDWPAEPWQALLRLALQLAHACAPESAPAVSRR